MAADPQRLPFFNGLLRRALIERGLYELSYAEIARQIGVDAPTVRYLLAGSLRPTRDMASVIAEALGLADDVHLAFIEAVD